MIPGLLTSHNMRGNPRAIAAVSIAIALFAGGMLAGCGGGGTSDEKLVTSSMVDEKDLPDAVIAADDLDRFSQQSPQRAFLEYWRDLQYQDLASALVFYEPGLRRAVGEDLLADALQFEQAVYRARKPGIVGTDERNGLASVRYVLTDLSDVTTPQSMTLRRHGADWEIVYDSFLGDSVSSLVQTQAQAKIDPSAQAPGAEAQRAGSAAAQRQVGYLRSVVG